MELCRSGEPFAYLGPQHLYKASIRGQLSLPLFSTWCCPPHSKNKMLVLGAHADDMRMSIYLCHKSRGHQRTSIFCAFTESGSLILSPEKCTLLPSNHPSTNMLNITAPRTCLPMEPSVQCLVVWWESTSLTRDQHNRED